MDSESYATAMARRVDHGDVSSWRRACGCIKTSDKLKHILSTFPAPPPPSSPVPLVKSSAPQLERTCISAYCNHEHDSHSLPLVVSYVPKPIISKDEEIDNPKDDVQNNAKSKSWQFVAEVVSLVQLSVTATALALYYIIYCYMQLVYCTLQSALYFHNADGPMKLTIAVVTVTSMVVGFNFLIRLERLIRIIPYI